MMRLPPFASEAERLQSLKEIRCHANIFAYESERSNVNRVFRFSAESTGMEGQIWPSWYFCVQILRVRPAESEPVNYTLLVRRPARELRNYFLFQQGAVPEIGNLDRATRLCQERGCFPMLVGVGESVDAPEGVAPWIWLAVVRLKLFNDVQAVNDPCQRATRLCGLRSADLVPVGAPVNEDRELVLHRELSAAGINQGGDDVVECRPQVVYHVAENDAEMRFFALVGDEDHIAPTGLFIDLTKPDRIRTVLRDARTRFSLKRLDVLDSPVDFSVAGTKV